MKRMMSYKVMLLHDEDEENDAAEGVTQKVKDVSIINAMEQAMQEVQDFVVKLRKKFRPSFRVGVETNFDVQEPREEPEVVEPPMTELELTVKISRQEMVRRNLEVLATVCKLDNYVTKELAMKKIKEHLKKLNA